MIIDGVRYAVRDDRIRARASLDEMLLRTDLPELVAGLVTRRGRVIPVFDLHAGISPGSAPPAGGCILVIQSRPRDEPGLPIGVCVDWVGEPVGLAAEDIESGPCRAEASPRLRCLATGRQVGGLLDIDGIVERSLFAREVGAAR